MGAGAAALSNGPVAPAASRASSANLGPNSLTLIPTLALCGSAFPAPRRRISSIHFRACSTRRSPPRATHLKFTAASCSRATTTPRSSFGSHNDHSLALSSARAAALPEAPTSFRAPQRERSCYRGDRGPKPLRHTSPPAPQHPNTPARPCLSSLYRNRRHTHQDKCRRARPRGYSARSRTGKRRRRIMLAFSSPAARPDRPSSPPRPVSGRVQVRAATRRDLPRPTPRGERGLGGLVWHSNI